MKIIIDGNDGVGKSTLVLSLKDLGYEVSDRGLPTIMTDDPNTELKQNEIYIILDVSVEISQKRLLEAGKDLNERYHCLDDLKYYREKFLEIQKNFYKNNKTVLK